MFDPLLFLYFFTLHADRLNFPLGSFNLRLNNLVALALLFLFMARYRTKLFRIDRALCISFLVLTTSITLSFLLSPYKNRCFYFLGLYGFTLLMYFLFPYLLARYYDIKKVITFYLFSFLCVGIYAFLQLLFSCAGMQDPFAIQFIAGKIVRPNAFAYEPSYYALYMTPFIVMLNFHFLADRDTPFYFFGKLTYPKILFVNFIYFASTSTSTVFAFAIFCFCLFFFAQARRHMLKYCLSITGLFIIFGLLSPYLMRTFFLKFFYSGFMTHHSFYERWCGIQNAWHVFQSNPYFGIGLGGLPPRIYDAYLAGETWVCAWQSELFFIGASNPIKIFEATNVFTEVLSSLGVIGALAFIGVIFVFLARAKQAARIDPTTSCSLLISVIVMVFVLQFNQGVFRTYVWVHFAFAFALVEKIVRDTTPLSLQDPVQGIVNSAQEELVEAS